MVNICNHDGCNKRPYFNHQGKKVGIYCSAHKMEGMINVVSKTCNHDGCNKIPKFNHQGKKVGIYCSAHKMEGMIDVMNKTCISAWCNTIVADKYKGYCVFCFMHIYPDEPITRNYKTKECAVVTCIKDKFPYVDWIADKSISGGCSRRRPDLIVDLGNKCVIIEIDENQHTDYDCICEHKRIMEISQDLGHREIVIIRFNPDKYTVGDKNITSCWGMNGNGICCIKKSKKKEWDKRLNILAEQIEYWLRPENITGKTIEIIQLFYDQ